MSASYQDIGLSDLQFDPENPRLPGRLHNAEEPEVIKHLLLEEGLIDLMGSIAEQGYFEGEPLLVVAAQSDPLKFVTVEGNRRLAALKLLASDEPSEVMPKQVSSVREEAKHRPKTAKVLVFQNKSDILDYLGYRHITGIKEWSPLQKARYLRLLAKRSAEAKGAPLFRSLAKEIGSRSDYVAKLLTGLALVERARDFGILHKIRLEEDDVPFSILTTAIGYSDICQHIGLSGSGDVDAAGLKETEFSEFFRWCFDKSSGKSVLRESRNLEKLARVVSHERALSELRRGADLDAADLYTTGPLDTLRTLLREAETYISEAQRNVPSIDQTEESDVSQANRISKAARALEASIKSLCEKEDDNS